MGKVRKVVYYCLSWVLLPFAFAMLVSIWTLSFLGFRRASFWVIERLLKFSEFGEWLASYKEPTEK